MIPWRLFALLLSVAVTMLVLTVWTWQQSAQPFSWRGEGMLAGQHLYLFSKLAAMISVLLLWWQCLIAIVIRPGKTRAYFIVHQVSALVLVLAVLAHYSLFVMAVNARQGHFPIALLGPQWGDFFHVAVTIGWMAFVGLLVVFLAALFRRYLGRNWHYLHRLAFVCVALGLIHGFMIGSETTSGQYGLWFFGMAATLVAALLDRLRNRLAKRYLADSVQGEA